MELIVPLETKMKPIMLLMHIHSKDVHTTCVKATFEFINVRDRSENLTSTR